jgi:hypothetical protein
MPAAARLVKLGQKGYIILTKLFILSNNLIIVK